MTPLDSTESRPAREEDRPCRMRGGVAQGETAA